VTTNGRTVYWVLGAALTLLLGIGTPIVGSIVGRVESNEGRLHELEVSNERVRLEGFQRLARIEERQEEVLRRLARIEAVLTEERKIGVAEPIVPDWEHRRVHLEAPTLVRQQVHPWGSIRGCDAYTVSEGCGCAGSSAFCDACRCEPRGYAAVGAMGGFDGHNRSGWIPQHPEELQTGRGDLHWEGRRAMAE